jgi:CheY-like chemotaxis protein
MRVLIIDDHPDTADMMATLVGLWGHEARVALDGPSGLALARSYHPDVVFLDITLPGMDGWEVAGRLRQDPGMAAAFLVATTGDVRQEARRLSREAGVDAHLIKPLDVEAVRVLLLSRLACWRTGDPANGAAVTQPRLPDAERGPCH